MELLSLKERMLIEAGFLPFKNSKKDGGPGSGNHGHKGVPGQVGGSAPQGSAAASGSAERLSKVKDSIKKMKPNQRYAFISRSGVVKKEELEALKLGVRAGDEDAIRRLGELEDEYFSYAEYGRTPKSLDVEMRDTVKKMTDREQKNFYKESFYAERRGWENDFSDSQFVAIAMGMYETPQVVSKEDFDSYVKESGAPVIYRGVKSTQSMTAEQMQFQMAYNTQEPYFGNGIYGDGLYFSTNSNTADSYAGDGVVSICALRPDAKVIDTNSDELAEMKKKLGYCDDSAAAMMLGYDAIIAKQGREDYYVILNRAALIMQDPVDDLHGHIIKNAEKKK